ncbi:MAG TPA: ATP-dependent DNA ligase [Candidatus Dependentiae bacterium]|nr:ATP-dependent DNA ligase [Candidatus Dependentiae bacterium]HRQ62354.1 ATP-dependent DNA ligase [Candidatus Dependentiae bacterium]
MKFTQVAQVFDKIEHISSRLEITQLLADLFKHVSAREIGIICDLSLGQLHPPYVATQFNIAEKMMIKVVAQLLNESPEEIRKRAKKVGDLGALVAEGSWRYTDEMTITQVYHELSAIEQISGEGAQEEKVNQLHQLLKELDPISAKFVIRIVLGKLRLGFSDMTIVDALSWMITGDKSLRGVIEDAYNVCADIGFIAQQLKEGGVEALKTLDIQIGIPIRPAAAERLPTAKDIIQKIGPCIAQSKLDGFRLQIHIDNTGNEPKVHFFSRNLQDMSFMFPDIVKALQQLDVDTIICEGEAIVYDPHTGSFLPFQETVKRKRKHGIEQAAEELPLKVFIFDLLYLNGNSFLHKTHEERRKQLLHVFNKYKGDNVQVIDEQPVNTAQELEDYFIANIAAGLEGLVVKRPDSVYTPGKRNFNWIKLKRQEEGHLEDTIDCVIVGYYAGKGKRAAFGIGAFLVAVYNKQEDMFQTIAKIGTGLTDEEWRDLKKKCDALAEKDKPTNIQCAKELIPDVWVYPELVCSIRADEITLSPLHYAGKTVTQLGYALRFPRFMGYRTDKSAEEATQVSEIKRLYEDQFKKIN